MAQAQVSTGKNSKEKVVQIIMAEVLQWHKWKMMRNCEEILILGFEVLNGISWDWRLGV